MCFLIRLALLVSLIAISHAHGLQIVEHDSHINLEDRSCETVAKNLDALSSWHQGAQKPIPCSASPQLNSAGVCVADITTCLPEFVVRHLNVNSLALGPNCWNLAFVMSGILPSLRTSNLHEAQLYLPSPLCRALAPQEERRAGDIGAIYETTKGSLGENQHTFIYISSDLAYTKNGFGNGMPYEFSSVKNIYHRYKVDDLNCQKNAFDPTTNCKSATVYYRCMPLEAYLATGPELPAEVLDLYEKLNIYEDYLEQRTFAGRKISPFMDMWFKYYLQRQFAPLSALADTHPPKSEKLSFFIDTLRWRIDSLRSQLMYLKDPIINHLQDEENDLRRAMDRLK